MAKDLKSQLNTFLRAGIDGAVKGANKVSEVIVEKSKQGKAQLDLAMLKRKRREALAQLGEVAFALCQAGKLDEGTFPELSSPLAEIESLDERIAGVGEHPAEDLDTEGKTG